MLSRRRIFRPARSSRRWGGAALGGGAAFLALGLIGLGLPANLFGSAPREQDWMAEAALVRVVDGDTLRLGDRTLRLAGLLSPQRGQTCTTASGVGFDCGAAAAEALARLVEGRDVVCRVQGRDHFGRALGTCKAGALNANAALVEAGWALADEDAPDLAKAEAAAHDAKRGLWSHLAGAPASWRARF
ncbi:thermonuclease family protein [Roseomonas sp. E05]|uniref:thermonuclease family protein n=1 Tax=Roseomonas sp. E05 TaxID=3046310 RepID=UPI0024B93B3F|nr:thermonuclease family protein [Roseomonas sp. E05]MDJ0390504.1 thermonuclease family protein [Roseomonas sp. E05]